MVSWLILRGRCRRCGSPISPVYPAVEILAATIALWGYAVCEGWATVWGAVLGWQLLALGAIDARTMLLPRVLTTGLIGSGLAVAFIATPGWPVDQLVGALAGYLAFQTIAAAYRHLRRREGMGAGDAKLLAGLGAWIGWQGLPTVVTYAAFCAFLFLAIRRVGGARLGADTALPFGPFLALGGWLVWLYGPIMVQASSR